MQDQISHEGQKSELKLKLTISSFYVEQYLSFLLFMLKTFMEVE